MVGCVKPGQRARLFQEVNDRIHELLDSTDPDLPGEFLCECGRECGRRIRLLPSEFTVLRRAGRAVRSDECVTLGSAAALCPGIAAVR